MATSDISHFPDVIGGINRCAAARCPRVMTPVVGPLRKSFSGISWHLGQAAISEKVLEATFALSETETRRNMPLYAIGGLWRAQRMLRGRKYGGFKFHPTYHDILWSQYLRDLSGTVVINNMQTFGVYFLRKRRAFNIRSCFYIDGTLTEYFQYAGVGDTVVTRIGADVMREAIKVEREGYLEADRIVSMSRATIRNLIDVYGIPSGRIALVMPGANLDDSAVPKQWQCMGWYSDEFTLGFVGLYPLRKGLDKIANAVQMLRQRGLPIRVRVIGRCPDRMAAMDGVEFLGPIDKATDLARFIEAIRSVDLGCQLSRAELTGIAMMEFLRVGVPIMATAIGGMPDVIEGGGGVLVPANITSSSWPRNLPHSCQTQPATMRFPKPL